ncbi:MAG: ribosome-associated translation inhibitor RaiA [Calditrichaeota bacterium]|nr:MAG: ribosome-associated translation inhibitor RaiA [Calditrichota bacterium]
MKLNIRANKAFKMSDAVKDRIDTDMRKLKKHFQGILDADVEINEEHNTCSVKVTLHIKPQILVAHDSDGNMYKALANCVHKLDRQLAKVKTKYKNFDHNKKIEIISELEADIDDE